MIVSNADPAKTYLDLIGEKYLTHKLITKLNETTYSCSSLILFLSVSMDVKKLGMDSGNIWIIPPQKVKTAFQKFLFHFNIVTL